MEDAETLKEILADIGVMKLQSSLEFLSGNYRARSHGNIGIHGRRGNVESVSCC
jgi:hypothetical protein